MIQLLCLSLGVEFVCWPRTDRIAISLAILIRRQQDGQVSPGLTLPSQASLDAVIFQGQTSAMFVIGIPATIYCKYTRLYAD